MNVVDFKGKNGLNFRIRNILHHEIEKIYEIQLDLYSEWAESLLALKRRWKYYPYGFFAFVLLGESNGQLQNKKTKGLNRFHDEVKFVGYNIGYPTELPKIAGLEPSTNQLLDEEMINCNIWYNHDISILKDFRGCGLYSFYHDKFLNNIILELGFTTVYEISIHPYGERHKRHGYSIASKEEQKVLPESWKDGLLLKRTIPQEEVEKNNIEKRYFSKL